MLAMPSFCSLGCHCLVALTCCYKVCGLRRVSIGPALESLGQWQRLRRGREKPQMLTSKRPRGCLDMSSCCLELHLLPMIWLLTFWFQDVEKIQKNISSMLMPTPVILCKPSVLFPQNLATRPELNCRLPALHLPSFKSFSQYPYTC